MDTELRAQGSGLRAQGQGSGFRTIDSRWQTLFNLFSHSVEVIKRKTKLNIL